MLSTFIKHPTVPSFVTGAVLGAVAVFRYNRHMQIFRSNAKELADIDATIERRKVLKDKLNQAAQEYVDMEKEYGNFFSANPNRSYYRHMWNSKLPEVTALQSFMPYARKKLQSLETGITFEEAEAQEYLMIIAAVKKTFKQAVHAAQHAFEEENRQKEAKLSEDEKV